MKLNWFSPLPPARTAIAAYAAAVLPQLKHYAEVTVWAEEEAPAADEVRRYRCEAPPWNEIGRADVSVYHIGNNTRFHSGIWEISRHHPGIVVLHDARLQEFVVGHAHQRGAPDEYVADMTRYYGQRGRDTAQDLVDGNIPAQVLVEPYPLTALFVERALGIVVHSDEAFDLAEPHACGPILRTQLPYPLRQCRPPEREWRPPFRLVLFGFLGDNRCLDTVLAALRALSKAEDFHLDIYGELHDSHAWAARLVALGLAAHVTLHGFVAANVLEEALDGAHLALNLRHPSRGESSFSLLQAWDHELPVVVMRSGSFEELPGELVALVRPEAAVDDLLAHLEALRTGPNRYRAMGAAARERLLRLHHPTVYAERLVRLAEHAVTGRTRCNALRMAERAGAVLRDLISPQQDDAILRRVAGAVMSLNRG